jgi:hypothetical protein
VRDVGILLADHDGAFKLVHAALGVVSIVLAALAWIEARRVPARSPAKPLVGAH